jgi:transcriptional regulator with PAS, ATPase and Fis domain
VNFVNTDVLQLFQSYEWPGNIRELENVIEAAIHLTKGEGITIASLPPYLLKSFNDKPRKKVTYKEEMEAAEKRILEKALKTCNFDKLQAAKSLEMSKSSFYDKLKKYDLH